MTTVKEASRASAEESASHRGVKRPAPDDDGVPHHPVAIADDDKKSDDDAFVASMTFASVERFDFCDCDECGGAKTMRLPCTFVQAVDAHKQSMPVKRTQDRQLVCKDVSSNLAVWRWTLPYKAEPLVEFGNSHRLVWVQHLPQSSCLKSIGTGIVGSQQEEEQRQRLDWHQGRVYFIAANGGKAVGWIHDAVPTDTPANLPLDIDQTKPTKANGSTKRVPSRTPVVLVMAKKPVTSNASADQRTKVPLTGWAAQLHGLFEPAQHCDSTSAAPMPVVSDLRDRCISILQLLLDS